MKNSVFFFVLFFSIFLFSCTNLDHVDRSDQHDKPKVFENHNKALVYDITKVDEFRLRYPLVSRKNILKDLDDAEILFNSLNVDNIVDFQKYWKSLYESVYSKDYAWAMSSFDRIDKIINENELYQKFVKLNAYIEMYGDVFNKNFLNEFEAKKNSFRKIAINPILKLQAYLEVKPLVYKEDIVKKSLISDVNVEKYGITKKNLGELSYLDKIFNDMSPEKINAMRTKITKIYNETFFLDRKERLKASDSIENIVNVFKFYKILPKVNKFLEKNLKYIDKDAALLLSKRIDFYKEILLTSLELTEMLQR